MPLTDEELLECWANTKKGLELWEYDMPGHAYLAMLFSRGSLFRVTRRRPVAHAWNEWYHRLDDQWREEG